MEQLLASLSSDPGLRASEDRLRRLLESAVDYAVATLDANGLLTSWNSGAANIFGWSRLEVLGRPAEMLLPATVDRTATLRAMLDDAIQNNSLRRGIEMLRKDGTALWANCELFPLWNDELGRLDGFLAILRDRSEQHRLEVESEATRAALRASEARLELALQAAQVVGTWDWDVANDRVIADARFSEMHNISPERGAAGVPMAEILAAVERADVPAVRRAVLSAIAKGGELNVEYRLAGATERWLVARGQCRMGADGRPQHFPGAAVDITDRKATERAVLQRTQQLAILNRLGRMLVAELDLDRVLQATTDAGVAILGAQFGAFFTRFETDAAGPDAGPDASYGLYTLSGAARESFAHFPPPQETPLFRPTFRDGVTVRCDDVTKDPRFGQSSYGGMPPGHLPVRSYLAVPVTARDGGTLGALLFGHELPAQFTEADEQLMTGLVAQAAIAVENALLYKSAQRELEERRRAEEALRDLSRRNAEILESIGDAFYAVDVSGGLTYLNARAEELWELPRDGVLGLHWAAALPAHFVAAVEAAQAEAQGARKLVRLEVHARPQEPSQAAHWVEVSVYPGEAGLSVYLRDIRDRKQAEDHMRLLINELNHRVKNSLAMVQAVATQTLRSSTSPQEASEAFTARLIGLAKAHDVLTEENWESADLGELVARAMEPHLGDSNRFHSNGPAVRLSPRGALSMAMAIHELATNAVKYGALSNETGQVDLSWDLEEAEEAEERPRLHLRWQEMGGPPVSKPSRRGFGSRLIERGLAAELGGRVEIAYEPGGVICDLTAPLGHA